MISVCRPGWSMVNVHLENLNMMGHLRAVNRLGNNSQSNSLRPTMQIRLHWAHECNLTEVWWGATESILCNWRFYTNQRSNIVYYLKIRNCCWSKLLFLYYIVYNYILYYYYKYIILYLRVNNSYPLRWNSSTFRNKFFTIKKRIHKMDEYKTKFWNLKRFKSCLQLTINSYKLIKLISWYCSNTCSFKNCSYTTNCMMLW